MNEQHLHDLVAAYALDALDSEEEHEFEEHLRRCAACREELTPLSEAAGALAFGVAAPPPPPELRERILEAARRERSNVVPLRSRTGFVVTSGLAAAAALVAIALGLWGLSLSANLDDERQARADRDAVLAVLAAPNARRFETEGRMGTLVVAPAGEAALVLDQLAPAPEGKTYEAWVLEGGAPKPAGLFEGGSGRVLHRLSRPVPPGAGVAVTLEPDGGVDEPTGALLLQAKRT
jgi:anti-sigma-K factor RskA